MFQKILTQRFVWILMENPTLVLLQICLYIKMCIRDRAYAVVSYQTAYLKYYYPREFMAALMTSVMDNRCV